MDPRGRGRNPTSTSSTPSIWSRQRCLFCEDNNSRVEVQGIVTSRSTTSWHWPSMMPSCSPDPSSIFRIGCHAWGASPAMLAQQRPVQRASPAMLAQHRPVQRILTVQVSCREASTTSEAGRSQRPRALPPVRIGPPLGLLLAARPLNRVCHPFPCLPSYLRTVEAIRLPLHVSRSNGNRRNRRPVLIPNPQHRRLTQTLAGTTWEISRDR